LIFLFVQGCVKAATAGVIAGWWYTPDYSDQVRDSCFKTMFYSIGSICLGGLLIGPVTILRQLSILFRPSQSEPSLLCLHECLHCIQTCVFNAVNVLTERCNDYSYAYVGMYHYGFFEAGIKATELFEKRGWTTIVSDDLVQNVLLLTSLAMGGMTGCFAHTITQMYDLSITPLQGAGMSSFVVGTVIGLVLSNIVFSVVSSAVNTVLICFASSPVEFEANHSLLSSEMRQAWREVWPDALDIHFPISYIPSQQTDSDDTDPLL
jgi:Plasma-membrane choline transporter